jgi:hypothetical protein
MTLTTYDRPQYKKFLNRRKNFSIFFPAVSGVAFPEKTNPAEAGFVNKSDWKANLVSNHLLRLRALGAIFDFKAYGLTFSQSLETIANNG